MNKFPHFKGKHTVMDFLLDFSLWRVIGALGIVLLAAWAVIFFLKRCTYFPSTKTEGKYLHLIDMLPFDAHHRLVLVSCDQQKVLILLSPKGEVMLLLPSTPAQET